MSKKEKALTRIQSRPRDYKYSEAKVLLERLGFREYNAGKTSGSRVFFYRESDEVKILLHKPHPGDIMSPGAIDGLYDFLKNLGAID